MFNFAHCAEVSVPQTDAFTHLFPLSHTLRYVSLVGGLVDWFFGLVGWSGCWCVEWFFGRWVCMHVCMCVCVCVCIYVCMRACM